LVSELELCSFSILDEVPALINITMSLSDAF